MSFASPFSILSQIRIFIPTLHLAELSTFITGDGPRIQFAISLTAERFYDESTSGYMILMNGGVVAYYSGRQSIVALCTAMAETIPLSELVEKVKHIYRMAQSQTLIKMSNKPDLEKRYRPKQPQKTR